MPTSDQRRHHRVIALQCDCVALARELSRHSTVRKNPELSERVARIAASAREANTLVCIEWFRDELDPAA